MTNPLLILGNGAPNNLDNAPTGSLYIDSSNLPPSVTADPSSATMTYPVIGGYPNNELPIERDLYTSKVLGLLTGNTNAQGLEDYLASNIMCVADDELNNDDLKTAYKNLPKGVLRAQTNSGIPIIVAGMGKNYTPPQGGENSFFIADFTRNGPLAGIQGYFTFFLYSTDPNNATGIRIIYENTDGDTITQDIEIAPKEEKKIEVFFMWIAPSASQAQVFITSSQANRQNNDNTGSPTGNKTIYQSTDPSDNAPSNAKIGDICRNTLTGNEFQLQVDGQTWQLIYCPFQLPEESSSNPSGVPTIPGGSVINRPTLSFKEIDPDFEKRNAKVLSEIQKDLIKNKNENLK